MNHSHSSVQVSRSIYSLSAGSFKASSCFRPCIRSYRSKYTYHSTHSLTTQNKLQGFLLHFGIMLSFSKHISLLLATHCFGSLAWWIDQCLFALKLASSLRQPRVWSRGTTRMIETHWWPCLSCLYDVPVLTVFCIIFYLQAGTFSTSSSCQTYIPCPLPFSSVTPSVLTLEGS